MTELYNAEDFIFDGVDVKKAMESHGFLFIINNTRGRGLLGQDANTSQVSGADGSRLIDVTFPEREIEIDYTLKADDLVGLRKAESYLASLLVRETEKPLSFADQKGSFKAVFTGFETDLETDSIQQGTISFLCPNPFRYKDTVELKDLAFEANVPQEITVDANYYSQARIEVTLSENVNKLELQINDALITYEPISSKDTLYSGSVVVFDGESQEVRAGGLLKVLEVTGEYPLFKSNLNTITVNASSLLSIKYRERDI